MKPYSRSFKKLRINNRRKFNAGGRSVSWEFSPRNYPRKVAPLSFIVKRLSKAIRQGLTKDQFSKYQDAMT